MKLNYKTKFTRILASAVIAVSLFSCTEPVIDQPTPTPTPVDSVIVPVDSTVSTPKPVEAAFFNIVYSTSVTGNTETYVQALADPTKGEVTFKGFGYEVPSTRSARLFASSDGRKLYNLDYGGGTVTSWDVNGGQDYKQTNQITVTYAIGTEYPRWTKFTDKDALIHYVPSSEKIYEQVPVPGEEDEFTDGKYLYTQASGRVVSVELEDLTMRTVQGFTFPRTEEDKAKGLYVGRIDAPAVHGGKAYYGLSKSANDANGDRIDSDDYTYQSTMLILDYPSLTNPVLSTSTLAKGSTYGYRIPVSYADEKGDIYSITSSAPAHILKSTKAGYDNSYVFNLTTALNLGYDVAARGWFYLGNGIGYATFYDNAKGSGSDAAAWCIARVDINAKTAIKMDVIGKLSLSQYQFAKVSNGKLYMALAPVGGDGNIYIFDPTKADSKGFTVGAKLITPGAGASYIGIF